MATENVMIKKIRSSMGEHEIHALRATNDEDGKNIKANYLPKENPIGDGDLIMSGAVYAGGEPLTAVSFITWEDN